MMFAQFKALFLTPESKESPEGNHESHPKEVRIAIAALLVEVARSDYSEDEVEQNKVLELLEGYFDLERSEVEPLMRGASDAVDDAIALHPFTEVLRTHLDAKERERVIEMMWAVAYADGVKDANEEYLVRKVADLIHVSPQHFVRARHKVEAGLKVKSPE